MSSLTCKDMSMIRDDIPLVLFVNGRKVQIEAQHVEPQMTLLTFLRSKLGLSGSKLGCGEGGCGACTVMVSSFDHDASDTLSNHKRISHKPVNACLAPLCSVHGLAVTTVEGIGNTRLGLHPVQERLAKYHGSQCGFCTPGIVMSMYSLLRANPEPTMLEIESAFDGNLCRCTGYRPILDAFKTFASDIPSTTVTGCGGCVGGSGCCKTKSVDVDQQDDADVAMKTDSSFFKPYDATQEVIFPPELMKRSSIHSEDLVFKGCSVTWYRPVSLIRLLRLKAEFPAAKIIVGNTEVGVEVKLKKMDYPILIAGTAIAELNAITLSNSGIDIGASVTLNIIEECLDNAIRSLPEEQTRTFVAMKECMRWFAGHQIRAVCSLGGSLATATAIADMLPILMTVGATVTVAKYNLNGKEERRSISMNSDDLFLGYRRLNIEPSEVIVNIHVPLTRTGEHVIFYKQARRRDDDVAIVNAAMRVLLTLDKNNDHNISEMSMAFGGMAPTIKLASETAKLLIGRPWKRSIVADACSSLAGEFPLSRDVPGGHMELRCALVPSFFFKFFLSVSAKVGLTVAPDELSATRLHEEVISTAVQDFENIVHTNQNHVVGKPLAHLSGIKHATGEALYVDDMPSFGSEELHAGLVVSAHAHARIISIDQSEALRMPGVYDFVSYADVPGDNIIGPVFKDEVCFVKDLAMTAGQLIGLIVADTQEHAQNAARKVKIEYEVLKPILSIEQAIDAGSFHGESRSISKGDLAAGFAAADEIMEDEMRVGGQEHFYLETNCSIAVPKGEDDEIEVFASTQNTMLTQSTVARVLGIQSNKVTSRVKRLGGGFGGKETRSVWLSAACAVAAYKTRRPVRCMLDRDEDMMISGGRHPFLGRYKVGFKKDGTITALELDMYLNAGYSMDLSFAVMERALYHMDNVYYIPTIRGTGYCCKTNLPSNTAFRGFGGPQGMMIVEGWMTQIAERLGMDQVALRRKNIYPASGGFTHFNQELIECQAPRIIDQLVETSDYAKRMNDVHSFNEANRWRKRGMALVPTKFGIAFTEKFMNQAGALVHIYTDGSVLLTHGGTEMGQGLHTKMVQVCAQALDIPISSVHLSETASNTVANTSPTAASASSDLNGMAILDACKQLNDRLHPFKQAAPDAGWAQWIGAAYRDRINLSANGYYATPNLGFDEKTNSRNVFNYFCYGASVAEVEIDILTGDHDVVRVDMVMDVGSSLNPAIDMGQVEGAFVQGQGLFTIEETWFNQNGQLITRGPGSYKIPGFKDIPRQFYVALLKDAPNRFAIHSSKAVGEPPLFLGAAVFYAIKDAARAARKVVNKNDKKEFRMDSPATCSRIRLSCGADEFVKPFMPPSHNSEEDRKRWNITH